MIEDDRFDIQGAVNNGELITPATEARKASAHKLVGAFASITRKRLRLQMGSPARTDGTDIIVPLDAPDAYKQLEHRLAHILFRTDTIAKNTFVEEYVRLAADQVSKHGDPLDEGQLRALGSLLSEILSIVECHRVESLWSLLYAGSYSWGRTEARCMAALKDKEAHEAIGTYLSILETGHTPPPGPMDRFKPYCVEALRKSELRGYNATLIVTKWLISHLVSEMIEEAKNTPPPEALPDLAGMKMTVDGQKGDKKEDDQADDPQESPQAEIQSEEEGESVGNSGQTPEEDVEAKSDGGAEGPGRKSDKAPTDKEAKGESDEVGKPDPNGAPGSGKWTPPKSEASAQARAQALKNLLEKSGHQGKRAKQPYEDTTTPKASSKSDIKRANKAVSEALKADTTDSKKLDDSLDSSKRDMLNEVEKAKDTDQQNQRQDEWLRKETNAKVVFRDIRAADVVMPGEMPAEDALMVQRLRAMFNRIHGRRRVQLEETGDSIDIEAYIARRVLQLSDAPIFKQEIRGRGFKYLILLDRSNSMKNEKTVQAERACRILSRALRYPYVQLHIWGFQSLAPGQVDIVRYDPRLESFTSEKASLGGSTPLHLALSVGTRFMKEGAEVKHILAVTDGFPVHYRQDGKEFPTRQLILETREEVSRARAKGVTITGAIIGNKPMYPPDSDVVYDLGARELRFIFGPNKGVQLRPSALGQGLVRLTTTGFVDYLKGV